MGLQNESKDWTGEYPTKAHYPLANEDERRIHRRWGGGILVITILVIVITLAWQMFK